MKRAAPLAGLLGALALAGCHAVTSTSSPPKPGTYTVGEPYQAAGIWRYPHEQFSYSDSGLAVVTPQRSGLTADGEPADPTALTAAHRTLQLPAIARVTNLETGRSLLVRLNDRGPEDPHRLVAVSPRAAQLLGAGSAPFRVRVELMEAESHQVAGGQVQEAHLEVSTAPQGGVQTETLAPPPGATASGRGHIAPAGPAVLPSQVGGKAPDVPLRLPEQVLQGSPAPGALYVELGSFARAEYASLMAARLVALGAQVSTDYNAPRESAFRVRIGPLRDTASADATLDRALRDGVSDARIVVDDF